MPPRTLTREVTYASLAPEWRQDAHARIVAAIEQLWPDRLDARAERLAHHAYLGHVWDKAARYLREAETKAFERSANRAAVSLLEKALTALGHLPQTDDTRQQAFAVHLDLRSSLYALGEFDRVVHYLEAAKAVAESLGDRRRLGLVYGHWAPFSDMAGDHHHALASGERALALADSLEDHRARVVGTYSVGLTSIYLGDYRAAADSLRRTIGLLDPDAVTERFGMAFPAAVAARAYLGLALAELGAFADATAIGCQAVEIAEAIWALRGPTSTISRPAIRIRLPPAMPRTRTSREWTLVRATNQDSSEAYFSAAAFSTLLCIELICRDLYDPSIAIDHHGRTSEPVTPPRFPGRLLHGLVNRRPLREEPVDISCRLNSQCQLPAETCSQTARSST